MSLNFEIGNGGGCVPPGNYRGKFVGTEPTHHEEYGKGIKWIWEVTQGEKVGEPATCITTDEPTLRNRAGRVIAGLMSTSLASGTKVSLDKHVGEEYLLQVVATANGSSRVDSVISMKSS